MKLQKKKIKFHILLMKNSETEIISKSKEQIMKINSNNHRKV
jgi:hypothetical protein